MEQLKYIEFCLKRNDLVNDRTRWILTTVNDLINRNGCISIRDFKRVIDGACPKNTRHKIIRLFVPGFGALYPQSLNINPEDWNHGWESFNEMFYIYTFHCGNQTMEIVRIKDYPHELIWSDIAENYWKSKGV